METIQLIALIIFLVTIGLIIWGKLDRAIVGIVGVALMVITGVMTDVEAFNFVDWNVIAILFGIWIIAGYFGKTGIPQYLAVNVLKISRNNIGLFIILIGILSGFISVFVDNVVVILMMAPVILHITKSLKIPSFPFLIYLGLSANFMGTALLLGDLPPQMLHSVSGIEFPEFIWQMGRPSSFIILIITFVLTSFLFYQFKFKKMFSIKNFDSTALREMSAASAGEYIKNKRFAVVIVAAFLITILAMSFRQAIGLHLGFIAIGGMIVLVLITEIFQNKLDCPSFEQIIDELDMRTLFFYIVLFALVGGIDHVGIINKIAEVMTTFIESNLILGTSVVYWVTAPIVGIVEHDAYILALLYLIRDFTASSSINPWPLYWAVLWAGTLGSNLTIAGAPALFVAQNICEKEESCKIGIKQFFSYTVPFVLITLLICYVLMLFIWVIPLS